MNVQQALKIIKAPLGKPSKMPGHSWGISAKKCITGSKLHKIKGTICEKCYALRNFYTYPNTIKSLERRLEGFSNPLWPEAMAFLILRSRDSHFRWFDSGDLQSHDMLSKICKVCNLTPKVSHWLPTKEAGLLATFTEDIPKNLVIRLSATKIDGNPPTSFPLTSTVHENSPPQGYACPVHSQGNKCQQCRMCWNPLIKNISYRRH